MRILSVLTLTALVSGCGQAPVKCDAGSCANPFEATGGGSATGGGGGGTSATGGGGGHSIDAGTDGGSATGGGGGAATGGGAGTGGGVATGGGAATGGGTGGALTVDFPVLCPTFFACGGPLGNQSLSLTSVCVDDSQFAPLRQRAEGACGVGAMTISSKSGSAKGSVTTSSNSLTIDMTAVLNFTVRLAGSCSGSQACMGIQQALGSYGYAGTCGVVTGACECQLTRTLVRNTVETYTSSGPTLTVTNLSPPRDYEYCASTGFAYFETTTPSGTYLPDPGYFHFTAHP